MMPKGGKIMKKALLLIVLCMLFFATPVVAKEVNFAKTTIEVKTVCVDGFLFVITIDAKGKIEIKQVEKAVPKRAFENATYVVPARCDN